MKRYVIRLNIIAAILLILGALSGCNTSGCTDNRSSIPLAGFYSSTTGTTITLDSLDIMGVGAPGDSLLLGAGTKASEVYLPLRSDSESVTYRIYYMYEALEGMCDDITIGYESYPYFASEECGAMYRYRIRSIDHSRMVLDSVAVTAVDSVITNANVETLRLFFRTN